MAREVINVFTEVDGNLESIRGYELIASRKLLVSVDRPNRRDLAELLRATDGCSDVMIRIELDKSKEFYIGKVYSKG